MLPKLYASGQAMTGKNQHPKNSGFDRAKLAEACKYQANIAGDQPYRILIVRHGEIAAEWNFRTDPTSQADQASASKSTFSSILGIAIREGVIKSEKRPCLRLLPGDARRRSGRRSKRWKICIP